MKLVLDYIKSFLKRGGSHVFAATVISRLFSFTGSWIALQLIENKELGVILFAYSIIQFIIPISGLGLQQSLIRYGALLTTPGQKEILFNYVFKKGVIASFIIIIILISIGYSISFQFENTFFYLTILSFAIVTNFFFEVVKVQLRLKHDNTSYAWAEIIYTALLMIFIYLLSYYLNGMGYALALVLTPLIAASLFLKKINTTIKKPEKLSIINFSFWKYGFFAGLSNVTTQLLFIIDMLLIGYLLNISEKVTLYKYISIIPFSLLFLPRVFITTDFVKFTENIYDKLYIMKYIKSYVLLFSMLSLFLLLLSFFFVNDIVSIFGKEFLLYTDSFMILIAGVIGIFIFRGLFGNLLSSIGKAAVNYYIVSAALILNIISNYFLIPKYGIKGAAITSAALMWFTGILSCICFFFLYKNKESHIAVKKE